MKLFFEIILLLSPIQTFVVSNIVKGLTLFNVGMILFTFFNIFYLSKFSRLIFSFILFLLIYITYFIFQQYILILFPPSSVLFVKAIFISSELPSLILFRSSFISQSLYLILAILFFYHLLVYINKYGSNRIINLAFYSIAFFVFYGFFEFFYFLLTGEKSDFISNRIVGTGKSFGAFQYFYLAGQKFLRIKSLAGEPSMFACTVLPFFILSIYCNKKRFTILFLIALLLSTSSSAIIGIFIYLILEIFIGYNRFKKLFISTLLFCIFLYVSYDFILALYQSIIDKISLASLSGLDRYFYFKTHFNLWLDSSFLQKLFGYGFGYFRSTDGFSTLLVNTGIFGLAAYCIFFLLPYFLIKERTKYHKGLFISNFTILIVILISVPELFMPHSWFFNALIWGEYVRLKFKRV
tara:strand:+ start:1887 stop:3113 length:1227 start_codon:yes stop_codon:yes gene_type:complete